MSVSEAILNSDGRKEYGLVSCFVHQSGRHSSLSQDPVLRVARPKQSLIIPWCVSEFNTPEHKLSEERVAKIAENKADAERIAEEEIAKYVAREAKKGHVIEGRARKNLVDVKASTIRQRSSHLILIVAEIQRTPDNYLGVPSVRIFNSISGWERGPDGLWDCLMDQIKIFLRTVKWLDGKSHK